MSSEDLTNDIYESWDVEREQLKFQDEAYASSSEKGIFKDFFLPFAKQLYRAGLKGIELYRFSVPIFILQPISVLESMTIHSSPTQFLFNTLDDSKCTLEERMLAITSWIIYDHVSVFRYGLASVKPYNPVLGEQFFCEWRKGSDITSFCSEQVSHHPPISAFCMESKNHGFTFEGNVSPHVSMGVRSFTTDLIGHHVVKLDRYDEIYDITLPVVKTSNVLFSFGSPKICSPSSSLVINERNNGRCRAVVKFDLKGKKSWLDGGVYVDNTQVYHLQGTLHERVTVTDLRTNKTSVVYDLIIDGKRRREVIEHGKRYVRPVEEQRDNESRRVWHEVTKAILQNDMIHASEEKNRIEDMERTRRKSGDKKNFVPELFEKDADGVWIRRKLSKGKEPYMPGAEMREQASNV